MRVVFFQRKPHAFHFSIEKIFEGVRLHHPPDVEVETAVLPHVSQGFMPRLKSMIWSSKQQRDINHITGDVHFIALGLQRKKTILTIHDLNFLNHPNPVARLILKLFWLTLPLKKVAVVTVISLATKKDLLSRINFPEHRIRVIPDFYEPSFGPSASKFNKEKPRILQVGTKANKNVLRLAEAVQALSCHLVIVGEQNHAIEQKLKANGTAFSWFGRMSDEALLEEYRKCDVLSFVSTIEGFGMPILEAQAIGKPVITSNISSMPEVAGDGACLVDPYDPIAIRNGLLEIITNDGYRNEIIAKGFENIKRFEVKAIAKLYYELYREVHANNKSV